MIRPCRIHVSGAAGSGQTSIGRALAARLEVRHLDVDDFYWLPTDPPFTVKREPEEWVHLLREAMLAEYVVSGSLFRCAPSLAASFDLCVLVSTPKSVRFERLRKREFERHGKRIWCGGDMFQSYLMFASWALSYDDPESLRWNRVRHEQSLREMHVPVMAVDGTRPIAELVEQIVAEYLLVHSERHGGVSTNGA